MRKTTRALRFARTWLTGRAATRESVIRIERDDRPVTARVLVPAGLPAPFPVWILLHGVTRPGIEHPELLRFARALTSTGALTLIPEVPEWKDLYLAPGAALPTVIAAVRAVRSLPEARRAPCALMGFSFGGPQALIAASHDAVAGDIAGVVSFGGYCDLERTFRFQFTGEHEWQGRVERVQTPDPYGRWVAGLNYLTASPGFGDAGDVAGALWELAAAAGEWRAPAASAELDALKASLRSRLASRHRALFDVFAPPSGREPGREESREVIAALVAASRTIDPLMDPTTFLSRLRHPVELLHGRGDTLMPYTESLRLRERLPERIRAQVTITRLFAHAREERFPIGEGVREVRTLFRALRSVFGMV
jgi:dienelactone hydrolase